MWTIYGPGGTARALAREAWARALPKLVAGAFGHCLGQSLCQSFGQGGLGKGLGQSLWLEHLVMALARAFSRAVIRQVLAGPFLDRPFPGVLRIYLGLLRCRAAARAVAAVRVAARPQRLTDEGKVLGRAWQCAGFSWAFHGQAFSGP